MKKEEKHIRFGEEWIRRRENSKKNKGIAEQSKKKKIKDKKDLDRGMKEKREKEKR